VGKVTVDPATPEAPKQASPSLRATVGPWPFRLLWASSVFNQAGFWTQQVGVGWLILELTNSAFQVGVASFARGFPMLVLGALGGVLVDRFDRRKMVLLSQSTAGVCALLMALLIAAGWIEPWHVYVLVFISGASITINFPARQSMVSYLVAPGAVARSVATIAAGQNGARMVSPGVAGALISASGTAACFYALVAVFGAALAMTASLPTLPRARTASASVLSNMFAGFRYIRSTPRLRGIMLLALVPTILALPYQHLLPVFARDVYDIGAAGLGMLLTATSIGAFTGALATTWLMSLPRRGLILPAAGLVTCLGLVLLALSPSVALTLGILAMTGGSISIYNSTTNALLQEATDDAYRGRVLSVYLMTWSMMPMGVLPAGALADHVGAPITVAIGGVLCAIGIVAVWLSIPALRSLR
jgi:MFS family permease